MEASYQNNPQPSATDSSSSLISALELAARSLSSSPSAETLAALRSAHRLIGSFLSQIESKRIHGQDNDEPMRDLEDEEHVDESKIIEEVEEGMRECVLQSKRRKRRVSPSSIAGREVDRGEEMSVVDPMERRRSAIDLVSQFHA